MSGWGLMKHSFLDGHRPLNVQDLQRPGEYAWEMGIQEFLSLCGLCSILGLHTKVAGLHRMALCTRILQGKV